MTETDNLPPLRDRVNLFFSDYVRPRFNPFNAGVAALAGLITAIFVVIVFLIVLVATNFNVLGWME